ncbi:lysophosphatidic acid receptor 6 [Diretmus argenteus]
MNPANGNCNTPSAEYQYHLFPAVYSIAVVLGLPGNLAVLFVLFKTAPRTSFNVYIINLAVADTVILCTLPFRIHYHVNSNNWVFGDVACRVTGTLFYANIYISICFMTCICVDRYVATVHPHTYLSVRTSCCSAVVSAVLWGVSGVAILSFILMGPLETTHVNGSLNHSCFENFAQHEWDRRMTAYSMLGLVLGSMLPSMVILVCYPMAARRISMIRTRTAGRAVRVIYTILAITVLCFLPYHMVYLLHVLRRMGVIQHCPSADAIYDARRVTMALVTLNTCLDPLLYYVTTGHCKQKHFNVTWLWGRVRRTRDVYTITMR